MRVGSWVRLHMLPFGQDDTPPLIFPCAAERTATSSRLASMLLDCMLQGSSRAGQQQQQPSPSTHSTPAAETAAAASSSDGGQFPVILIACVESAEDVPASFRRCFTHELQLEAPDSATRMRLLRVRCLLSKTASTLQSFVHVLVSAPVSALLEACQH